jgi:uncharacterized protein
MMKFILDTAVFLKTPSIFLFFTFIFFSSVTYGRSQFTLPPLVEQSKQGVKPAWCKHNLKSSEQLICSSPPLWALEEQNVTLYYSLYADKRANKEELSAWLRYRANKCDSIIACQRVYHERIAVLIDRKKMTNGNDEVHLFPNDKKTQQPSWCVNTLNQTETFICQQNRLWRFDYALNSLYQNMTKKEKKALKMTRWRKKRRNVHCKTSVEACMTLYHEAIYRLHYLQQLR